MNCLICNKELEPNFRFKGYCARCYHQKYYRKNIIKIKESHSAWQKNNRDRMIMYGINRKKKNADKIKEKRSLLEKQKLQEPQQQQQEAVPSQPQT
jgi:hypothetical protein